MGRKLKKAKKKVQDTDWEDKTRRTAENISSWAAKFAVTNCDSGGGSVIQNTEVNMPYVAKTAKSTSIISIKWIDDEYS